MEYEARSAGQLWVEDEKGRRRMPDPVRAAAVRAVLLTSVTLIQGMAAFLFSVTGSWLGFPLLISSVASTVVATWSVLDVWVTRQVWRQRNGVVSEPSSTARQLRRDRRQAQKAEKAQKTGKAGKSGEMSEPEQAAEYGRAGHAAARIRPTESALSEAA